MITLVLGGTRSGKSAVAEALVDGLATSAALPVTYLATATVGDDHELAARVARHRDRRPSAWTTAEVGSKLVAALRAAPDGTALVDSLGTWVAAHPDLSPDVDGLVAALVARTGPTVLVSEEVGMAVHPETEVGRRFVDALGQLNLAVAAVADEVLLVVAGRVLRLEPPLDPPVGRS